MAKKKFHISESELKRLYVDEQQSMSEMAAQFGCSVQTICNLIRKAGIEARLATKHTARTKAKQSKAKSGNNHPQFGKLRPEHAIKMQAAMKGRIVSKETRSKMSAAKNGKWGGKYVGSSHPKWLLPEQRKAPLYKQIRDCVKMHEWRKMVFERDNYTCQGCQKRGGTLNADHIKQFALILKENGVKTLEEAVSCQELWQLSNGRTLCDECHRKTETFAKRVN